MPAVADLPRFARWSGRPVCAVVRAATWAEPSAAICAVVRSLDRNWSVVSAFKASAVSRRGNCRGCRHRCPIGQRGQDGRLRQWSARHVAAAVLKPRRWRPLDKAAISAPWSNEPAPGIGGQALPTWAEDRTAASAVVKPSNGGLSRGQPGRCRPRTETLHLRR